MSASVRSSAIGRLHRTPAEGAFLFPALSAYWPDYCTAVVAQARRAHRTEALAKAAAGRALLKVESATQIDGEFQAQIDEIVEQGLLSE